MNKEFFDSNLKYSDQKVDLAKMSGLVGEFNRRITALEEGGGGGGLPVPTPADLGKVIGVVFDPDSPGETVLLLSEQGIVLTSAAVPLDVDANVFYNANHITVMFNGTNYTVYKSEGYDDPHYSFSPNESTAVSIYYNERTLQVMFNVENTQDYSTIPGTYQLEIKARILGVKLGFMNNPSQN